MTDDMNFFGKLDQHCSKKLLNNLWNDSSDSLSQDLTDDDELDDSLNLCKAPALQKFQSKSKLHSKSETKSQKRSDSQDKIVEPPSAKEPSVVRRNTRRSTNQVQPNNAVAVAEPQPVAQTAPPVTQTAPPVTQTAPPVTQTAPPVTQTAPPVQSKRSGRRSRRGQQQPPAQNNEPVVAVECIESPISNSTATTTRGRRSERMSRRQAVSEIAARSTQVGFIDLVSSPFPRVEGMISLLSDDEETGNTKKPILTTTSVEDALFEESNPEICIKVVWCGKYETFTMRKYQKLLHIFNALAEKEQITINQVLLNLNDCVLKPEDSAASIDYKVFDFIYGRIITYTANNLVPQSVNRAKKCDANEITLKVQSDKWKHAIQVGLGKTDKFRILFIKCAEELNVPIQMISLNFDGEPLSYDGTPLELEFEGGEAIDLRLQN